MISPPLFSVYGLFGGSGSLGSAQVAALGGILGGILVETEHEEAQNALVAAESGLELLHESGIAVKLYEVVVAGGLLLDGVGELALAPELGVHDLGTVVGEHLRELFYRFLCLFVRQNGS